MNDRMTEQEANGAAARIWWERAIGSNTIVSRAARARMRRATGTAEILCLPEAHALNAALPKPLSDPHRLALLVRVLINVDRNGVGSLARRFGARTKGRRRLSELRFQQLVRAGTPRDLVQPLVRALPAANRTCNVASLAVDMINWNEATRTLWCFEYFGTEPSDN